MTIYIDVDVDGTVCVYDGNVENGYEVYDSPHYEQVGAFGSLLCSTFRLDDLIALAKEVEQRNALGEDYSD